ncbi:MAG: hypothetical protein Q7I93_05235, partial [Syntrophales bacterium]|nr:hypothetical protein [Syntrophales bacterium]
MIIKYFFLFFFILLSLPVFATQRSAIDRMVTLPRVIRVSVFLCVVLVFISLISMLAGPSQFGTFSFLKAVFYGLYGGDF